MNLAEAILELADEMGRDLAEHFKEIGDQYQIKYYMRLLRGWAKSCQPKPEATPNVTATIAATHLPGQPKPKSLLTAPIHEDPWKGEPLPRPPIHVDDDDYDPRDP